jgi:hypothetical protein
MAVGILASAAQAQQIVRGYPPAYPPPYPPSVREYPREEIYLGHSHVDGPVDHDNIRVDRYDGRFRAVELRVTNAPIRFDRVVIHYGDGEVQALPVNDVIPPGGTSRWINLPGGDRRIYSVELWYARAEPELRIKPEVQLFGRP